ncbi:BTB and MATH domain-containing protein 38-like [Mytilus edulis]|uniref:BTB and MATH domain-containing protein 38-like n=1 Tax=Mytilus edulis TaxID=6550 RepID=UPI0039F0572C
MDESILPNRRRRLIAALPEEVPLSLIRHVRVASHLNDSSSDSDDDVSTDSVKDLERLTSREKNLASPFNEPNIALVFGTSKLYVQRDHLINVSPVFEAMFSSKFLEGSLKEIPLPGKKLSHFIHFLRYLSPGFEDALTEDVVHHMLPLADEYQTDDLKKRIEEFLITGVRSESDSITSVQTIKNILEAEKYKLNGYLNACIAVASRKTFTRLTSSPKFEEISQNTQLKISLKRWEDIDKIYRKVNKVDPMSIAYNDDQNELFHPLKKRNYPIYIRDVGKDLKPYMQEN